VNRKRCRRYAASTNSPGVGTDSGPVTGSRQDHTPTPPGKAPESPIWLG
jgi:hypothetical protein